MKRMILALCVLASVASCKKDKNDVNCEVSVTGIAASYKITKIVVTAPGIPNQDVTSSYMNACELSGVYQLKSDKTVVYTETASCFGNGTGTWDVVASKMTVTHNGNGTDFNAIPVSAWDCSTLTLSEDMGNGAKLNYTLTKQ